MQFRELNFAKNSMFGKILKLLLKNDYAEWNCVWLDKMYNAFSILYIVQLNNWECFFNYIFCNLLFFLNNYHKAHNTHTHTKYLML